MQRRLCTPEDMWCEQAGNEQDRRYKNINPELVTKLGECGVACKGELAENLRDRGYCGLQGAIMEALAWQQAGQGMSTGDSFERALKITKKIIVNGADPAVYITHPPGNLSPKRTQSEA